MLTKISFANINSDFSAVLKKKVYGYFASQQIPFTGNRKIYFKTGILLSALIINYLLLVFATPPVWLALPLCLLMGFNLAAIGFNVMHDGAHGSYSRKRWVNEVMGYSLNLMGGNSYIWKQKHNINHHSFTNVEGYDDDIDIQPWIRTNINQPKRWYHRYQYIYWIFLYGLIYITWVFVEDFNKYFSGKIANTKFRKMNMKEHVIFWLSKAVFIFIFIVLPVLHVGLLETIVGYTLASFVCGFVLSIVFQLAHVVEGPSFPLADTKTQTLEQEWTIHQLATTANFSTSSKIISWFVGGLNFQIEHHLFPKISHVHYPVISKMVKEVCLQFNVRYIEYPTLFSALRSHVVYLKNVGVYI